MKNNHNLRTRYLLPATLAVAGGIAGFLYYRFIGCATGTCAITSNPYVSSLYGGVLGLLIGSLFVPGKREHAQNLPSDETDA